ncbi:MAG: CCA tRNA nucleotidyltransferase [Acidobacteriales bacterium]|nr:CCA tRNA nucleotidyltransferase [Terriglobales bacterium]
MADYIYTMEIRLTPEQQRAAAVIQEVARNAGMNLYMTGGAIRDLISGFTIRDLDFTVQGNPLKLQKELERRGVRIGYADEHLKELHLVFPGNVRAEMGMARTERYEKVGKPPVISPSTILEDLRRRDFTMNAMALSLNPGSRGLLMDPFNGTADVEAKVIRILNNYSFAEDPSRLIRVARFNARFHWPMEERTQARYESAKENDYIEHISDAARGYEIEQLAYEDDPLTILRTLENEGWLKALHPHWAGNKIDAAGLGQLMKTRQQMNELGYWPDAAPAVFHFLTAKLGDKDVADIRKLIFRKDLVTSWKNLDGDARELAKQLQGKEASTPSRTWTLLSNARPESILFLSLTSRNQNALQKVKDFFTTWREVRQKLPLPEMTELHITPEMPDYPKIADEVFMNLLDGKLRTHNDVMKFLKPLAPPPPPPPPPARRGRGAKSAAASTPPQAAAAPVAKKQGKAPASQPAAEASRKSPKKEQQTPTAPSPAAGKPAKDASAPASATVGKVAKAAGKQPETVPDAKSNKQTMVPATAPTTAPAADKPKASAISKKPAPTAAKVDKKPESKEKAKKGFKAKAAPTGKTAASGQAKKQSSKKSAGKKSTAKTKSSPKPTGKSKKRH